MNKRSLITLLLASALPALAPLAHAADGAFPTRPLKLIVVTAPGGGSDTVGRLIGQKLAELSGQPVVVENRPGAGGVIGTKALLSSPADGYTLLLATSSTHGINPWFYPNIGYDAVKDFAPVSILATTDYAIATPVDSPYKTIGELLAAGKARKVDYGSSGNGTTTHLAAALLSTDAQASKFVHVPYKAAMNALNGLLGGEVGFMFENTSLFTPFVQSGKVRLLATTGAKRSPVAPGVPTLRESGLPDYEITGWFALLTNANVPPPTLEYLNRQVVQILKMPDVVQKLGSLGYEPSPTSLPEGQAYVASQLAKFGDIVKRAGIKPE